MLERMPHNRHLLSETGTLLSLQACMHIMSMFILAVQVFLSEQVLYSKQQLTSHKQHGDREGPLAESGFTGHCHCK